MNLVMLGTGPFAVPTLRRLHGSRHGVVQVVTRPPRGRGETAPMAVAAAELGVPLWQPDTVNSEAARTTLRGLAPELFVVCDYGEILKSETLAVAPHGGINLHGSLLPKYRGAAPVQWAILNGETETGNTVIQMTAGLDSGPCLGVQRVAIDHDETAGELERRLAEEGAELALSVVDAIAAGTAKPQAQGKAAASKAPRLQKEDGRIDWSPSAVDVKNRVRAFHPWPKAFTHWQRGVGEPLRLIIDRVQAIAADSNLPAGGAVPGSIVESSPRLVVATGEGLIEILQVQPAGKRLMSAAEFLRGYPLRVGERLGG